MLIFFQSRNVFFIERKLSTVIKYWRQKHNRLFWNHPLPAESTRVVNLAIFLTHIKEKVNGSDINIIGLPAFSLLYFLHGLVYIQDCKCAKPDKARSPFWCGLRPCHLSYPLRPLAVVLTETHPEGEAVNDFYNNPKSSIWEWIFMSIALNLLHLLTLFLLFVCEKKRSLFVEVLRTFELIPL